MSTTNKPAGQIVGIDFLRAAAASLVMLYHYQFWYVLPTLATPTSNVRPSWWTFHFGWCGVEIFFVISGFAISYSAHAGAVAESGRVVGATRERHTNSAKVFAINRFIRLAPAAWICATLTLIVYLCQNTGPATEMIRRYGLTLVFWPFDAIDGVYWSLGVELSFYTLVAALIWRRQMAHLETVMSIVGFGSLAFWVAVFCSKMILNVYVDPADYLHILLAKVVAARIFQLFLVQHGCFFALGVLFIETWRWGLTKRRALVVVMLLCGAMLEIVGQNRMLAGLSKTDMSPLVAMTTFLSAMAFMVCAIRFNEAWSTVLGRHGVRFSRILGRLTYPVYLIQTPVFKVLVLGGLSFTGLPRTGLAISLAFATAWLVERYPERMVRHALRSFVFAQPGNVVRGGRVG